MFAPVKAFSVRYAPPWSKVTAKERSVRLQAVEQRFADALKAARRTAGEEDVAPFARRVFLRVGLSDPPTATTYRRWEANKSAVPAWALMAAAEEAGVSVEWLLSRTDAASDSRLRDLVREELLRLGVKVRDPEPQ